MGLNKEQQDGFMEVIKFMNNPNEQFMDISGGAGTGKTYFISQVADGILKHKSKGNPLHTVTVTATTNKAAAVISEAMPYVANDIGTIYSFMNLRVSENFSTGTVSVVPTRNWIVHSGVFLIIDECSMINKDLFKYLQKGLDNTCKVLFVGDKNQLAPVKETISPIYTQNYKTAHLVKPVRNAEQPALMDLCEQMRQTVLTGVFTPIKEVPGVIDFVDKEVLRGVLEREYASEDKNKRVLSYTNKRVVQYNQFIRELRSYKEPYEVGEILSNNESAELPGKVHLYTDQLVKVTRIVSDQEDNNIVPGHSIRTVTLEVEDIMTSVPYNITSFASSSDRRDVLNHYASSKNWDRYFKIKNQFPDLRAIASSTIHKAQGSTYDSVIVDLADIGTCTNKDQTARMQYVAMSRPKKRIYIRGELPKRYFD